MACAQRVDEPRRQVALARELVEPVQHRIDRGAPRRDFGGALLPLLVLDDLAEAEPAQHRGQRQSLADKGDEDDPEGEKDDQVAVGKRHAGRGRERQGQRRGERDDAAHAEERHQERAAARSGRGRPAAPTETAAAAGRATGTPTGSAPTTTATVVTSAAIVNSTAVTWSTRSSSGRASSPVSRNSAPSRRKMNRSQKKMPCSRVWLGISSGPFQLM